MVMDYCFDIYLEFVPTLFPTTSSFGYYEWENAIINCYMIGELPLNLLVNLARQSFSLPVKLWFRRMQLEQHGPDHCTSWYETKEVLRHRFAPALEPMKHILSSGGSFSLDASDFSASKQFEKNASVEGPVKMVLPSDPFTATSIVEAGVQVRDSVPNLSSTPEQQVCESSCDDHVEALITTIAAVVDSSIDSSNESSLDVTMGSGLSLMSHEVHSDGTISAVKGQRSIIFQSECKIQDKVCKLIIDGGSFTNAISLDMVHALSLSTWRLPTPRYMQWMNQSGTLKITHKARVKFSVGDYVDSIDCDVAPMSACHLLLGRPWQFDLDAAHGGRSNIYSFMHKGVHHVLKPMPESAIKAEVFVPMKLKQKPAVNNPKPKMALLQEGERDVSTPTPKAAVGVSKIIHDGSNHSHAHFGSLFNFLKHQDIYKDQEQFPIKFGSISSLKQDMTAEKSLPTTKKMEKIVIELADSSNEIPNPMNDLFHVGKGDATISSPVISEPKLCIDLNMCEGLETNANQFGTLAAVKGKNKSMVYARCKTKVSTQHYRKEGSEFVSKPRTALFQGREDDEPVPPNIHSILAGNSSNISSNIAIQIGGFSCDIMHDDKRIFMGERVQLQCERKEQATYIMVGSIKVLI
ncbi:unnamed protein product [Urochloa humidicola]